MNSNVGYKIRELRKNNDKTLKETAINIGIAPSTLGMYERGDRNPSIKCLFKLANYFNVGLEYFLDDKEEIESIKLAFNDIENIKKKEKARLRAGGKCELCGNQAPFNLPNGVPFLEEYIFDKKKIEQIVMLCSNCKRKIEVLCLPGEIEYLKNICKNKK